MADLTVAGKNLLQRFFPDDVETARVELASSESARQLSTRLLTILNFRARGKIGYPLMSAP